MVFMLTAPKMPCFSSAGERNKLLNCERTINLHFKMKCKYNRSLYSITLYASKDAAHLYFCLICLIVFFLTLRLRNMIHKAMHFF